ncbi:MAG TPA: transcription antitermination factor NusB [Chthonomonadaceae bacterium]|nr:transcription antitermination factor NusB [Chthonomonadaceae bacterium]
MISARRLAREWALKILYQVDVGKVSLQEAQNTAMERLRMEFVQRGSRTASGSRAEQIGLNTVTADLRDIVAELRQPQERVVVALVGRLFDEVPLWQEVRFEKSFRNQMRGVALIPPRLLELPAGPEWLIETLIQEACIADTALSAAERARLTEFTVRMREELPRLMEPELRKTALAFARDLARNRPIAAGPDALQGWLRGRREEFNRENAARWLKVGQMVQKQIGDWLRVATFTVKLVQGVDAHSREVNRAVSGLASGWKLERQVAVDRNILRLAGFEMLFLPGVPTSVSINEAVELAKKYSTAESGRFVNGVLGALAQQVGDKLPPTEAAQELESEASDAPLDLPEIGDLEDEEDEHGLEESEHA